MLGGRRKENMQKIDLNSPHFNFCKIRQLMIIIISCILLTERAITSQQGQEYGLYQFLKFIPSIFSDIERTIKQDILSAGFMFVFVFIFY